MNINFLSVVISFVLLGSAFGETRIWTLKNGKTLEADFQTIIGGKVSLKTLKGKIIKVPEESFSAEDLNYIDLNMPPKLDLSFSKTSKTRVFPDSFGDLPSSQYFNFKATAKQNSSKVYSHDLTMELFIVGEEKAGDKYILLDYQKENFRMKNGRGSLFELPGRQVELIEFEMNGQLRGEVYTGYMIVVTDSRGEVIAYNTKREKWFQSIDNLRKLPLRKLFDDEGNRSWPTRPKRFY